MGRLHALCFNGHPLLFSERPVYRLSAMGRTRLKRKTARHPLLSRTPLGMSDKEERRYVKRVIGECLGDTRKDTHIALSTDVPSIVDTGSVSHSVTSSCSKEINYLPDAKTGLWASPARFKDNIDNLINQRADSSRISQVISSGKEMGVHYSAFDTHKVTGSSSCCATLIYKCRVPTCDSNIAITVTGGIISKIRFQSDHNHRPTTDERREVECSVCYQSGHNKRSCPTALEMKRWKEGPWIGSIKRKWFGTDGWKLCSFKRIDLLRITAHMDVSMPENVRNYFYYAPNNSNGIYVKLNLFKKLFEMNEKIEVSIQWILNGKCSHRLGKDEGIRGSMIYAFHWYLVYKLLDDPENVASRIGEKSTGIIHQLKQYEESLGGAGFTIELQQVSGALAETQLWLEHALLVISSVKDKRLIVNRENMHEVCNSLVRTFVEEMVVTGDDGSDMSHRLLKGCWILKDVKICMPLDLDKYRPHLKRLRAARLSRWTGPPPT